jgi:hypothetical protein
VKIVEDGDKTAARLGEVVTAIGCIDKGIGRVTGPFEGDGDLLVFHSEVGDTAMNLVPVSQQLDDAQLVRRQFVRMWIAALM